MTHAEALLTLIGELRQQLAEQAVIIAAQQAEIERLTAKPS